MENILKNIKPVDVNTMAVFETAIEILSELDATLYSLSSKYTKYSKLLNEKQVELNEIETNLNLDNIEEIDKVSSKYALALRDYYKINENNPEEIEKWIKSWFAS